MNFDIYEKVTNRIIEELKKGFIPWKKPWTIGGEEVTTNNFKNVAFNRITKKAYTFLNQMLLSKKGEYASFKQWKELGGKIKKGAKAEIIVFWKMHEIISEDSEETKIKRIPILKYLSVFHIDDIEGITPLNEKDFKTKKEFKPVETAEKIINDYLKRENINLIYEGNRAFYNPNLDFIKLPERFKFKNKIEEFYSTTFHEITHSTGAKTRLNRLKTTSFFGSEDYSKEELVAEIGACGLLNILEIESESSFRNNTAYIQSWLKVLQDDKKLIVTASAQAEKAIKFILNKD